MEYKKGKIIQNWSADEAKVQVNIQGLTTLKQHKILKLSEASFGESSILKEGILNMIHSLTPQQAARNALAAEFRH